MNYYYVSNCACRKSSGYRELNWTFRSPIITFIPPCFVVPIRYSILVFKSPYSTHHSRVIYVTKLYFWLLELDQRTVLVLIMRIFISTFFNFSTTSTLRIVWTYHKFRFAFTVLVIYSYNIFWEWKLRMLMTCKIPLSICNYPSLPAVGLKFPSVMNCTLRIFTTWIVESSSFVFPFRNLLADQQWIIS